MRIPPLVYVFIGLAVFAIIYGFAGITHVNPGETVLLIKNYGSNRGMQPGGLLTGTHWIDPWTYDTVTYNTLCRQMQDDPEEIKATTGDGQPVQVDFTIEVCLDPAKVSQLHSTMGEKYYETRIHPRVLGIMKNKVPSKPSSEAYTAAGRQAIEDAVNAEMKRVFDYSGIQATLNLRDINFTNKDYLTLLEQKAGAEQKVLIETRNAEAAVQSSIRVANIAEGEKQKRIKAAEADREEQRLSGEGERLKEEERAKGILAVATAEATGTRLRREALSGAGGENLVQIEWAHSLGPKMQVYGVPTGAPGTTSFMDLNGLLKGALKGQ